MKIRTKLWLNVVLTVVSTIIICLIIIFPIQNRFKMGAKILDLAEKISNDITLLNNLTHEYLLYNENRVYHQWEIKSSDIQHNLKKISKILLHQNQARYINQMITNHNNITEFFKKISDHTKNPTNSILLKRLESFSLLNSRALITNAIALKNEIHSNQKKIIFQGLWLILTTLLLIMVINVSLTVIMNRTIYKSLNVLNEGVRNVSQGNLIQNLNMPYPDEMGALANAFNQMTQKLEGLYNNLKKEIQTRQKSEQSAKENEEKYRLLFNSGSDAIFVISINSNNLSSRFIECNDIACQKYGYSKTELLTMPPKDLNAPEVSKDVGDKIKKVIDHGHALIETIHQTKTKQKIPVEISAHTFTLNNETAILATVRDVSERKAMQNQLMEVLELNQTIISESLLGIIVYTKEGQCIIANEVSGKSIGGTKERVLEQNYHQLENWKATGLYDAAENAMKTGEPQKKVIHVVTSFGKDVWLKCHFNRFHIKGQPHLLLMFDNITEQKKIEQELRQKNKELERSNKELDDFAYIASHDLKEPLRGISSYSAFLLEDYQHILDADGRNKLTTLVELCQREEKMVESLLWYSRLGRAELSMELVDINVLIESIRESIHVLISEHNVEIKIPRTLPKILTDRIRLNEIFMNLITNAIKYNDKEEKWVELGFKTEKEDGKQKAENGSSPDPSNLIFYVRDNGIGIREKHLNKVFIIFKRLYDEEKFGAGTGIGLTIIKKNVEKLGGRIWLESTFKKGTTFYFTLPQNSLKIGQ